jgi:hypothetical protein
MRCANLLTSHPGGWLIHERLRKVTIRDEVYAAIMEEAVKCPPWEVRAPCCLDSLKRIVCLIRMSVLYRPQW